VSDAGGQSELSMLDGCHSEPANDGMLSQRERDLRDWGLVYGIAFATARAAAPDEDEAVLAERSLEAARAAWRRWSDEIAPRPALSPLVDDVLLAFHSAETPMMTLAHFGETPGDEIVKLRPLGEALFSLRAAIGVPADPEGDA
jgi:hypothetical protein